MTDLEDFFAYNRVEYGIPVDVEAFEIELKVTGSSPDLVIVIGEP